MAKVIRDQWVYKRNDRWWRHLPRRGDDHPKMSWADEDIHQTISTFPEPMQSKPPKLWIAWLYREWSGRTHGPKVRDHIKALFGHQAKPGEIQVFKNTPSTNIQLWKIKHLIEIRPLTFPNGEPDLEDIYHTEIMADGRCVIDRNIPNPTEIKLVDTRKQFTDEYLTAFLISRDIGSSKDVYEDTVYNPANISIID